MYTFSPFILTPILLTAKLGDGGAPKKTGDGVQIIPGRDGVHIHNATISKRTHWNQILATYQTPADGWKVVTDARCRQLTTGSAKKILTRDERVASDYFQITLHNGVIVNEWDNLFHNCREFLWKLSNPNIPGLAAAPLDRNAMMEWGFTQFECLHNIQIDVRFSCLGVINWIQCV